MDVKSLVKSAVLGSAFALLAGGSVVAIADPGDVEDSITAVADADDLDEMLEANNVDTGTQGDVNEDLNDNSNDEAQSDGSAENDMEDNSDMAGGTADASQGQEDVSEATQQDEQDDSNTPPPG